MRGDLPARRVKPQIGLGDCPVLFRSDLRALFILLKVKNKI